MKTVGAQLAHYLRDPGARRNLRALGKLLVFFLGVVALYTALFHLLMAMEGQQHSLLSGLYWVIVVMSTLGFGDITFHSDAGRVFSLVVLLSGVLMLLVVLPFAFIQYFYAPWLEARVRLRAPRGVAPEVEGHVISAEADAVGLALVRRFRRQGVPYVVVEEDTTKAAQLHSDGRTVATGEMDDPAFLTRLGVERARLVFANRSDIVNTAIVLTVQEVAPAVPVAAVAERVESEDVLELNGAAVLPLKRWLGEQLANRVGGTHAGANVVGHYHDLLLAEVPARHTPLAGRTIRETRLREATGVSFVGVWDRGRLVTARPETLLTDTCVPVVVGTREQLDALDDLLLIYDFNLHPVVVLGAGKVGRAAARALRAKEVDVHIVERDPVLVEAIREEFPVFAGDASDLDVLTRAGIQTAPAAVLTTHDDAMNIFLASYCRRLNPEVRIVSRITHERNVESVHRAGADFALSYTSLGMAAVLAHLEGKPLAILGGALDLYTLPLPRRLAGKTLAESGIGAKTGLSVLAVQHDGAVATNPPATTVLPPGAALVVLGDPDQRAAFERTFRGSGR